MGKILKKSRKGEFKSKHVRKRGSKEGKNEEGQGRIGKAGGCLVLPGGGRRRQRADD